MTPPLTNRFHRLSDSDVSHDCQRHLHRLREQLWAPMTDARAVGEGSLATVRFLLLQLGDEDYLVTTATATSIPHVKLDYRGWDHTEGHVT